jgi:4-cresol dehydrogenase (hydroxylating)
MEVILPDGRCIHTGFGRFDGAKAGAIYRHGVGPALDGIFLQSNLGIVTKITLWLSPRPSYFATFTFTFDDDTALPSVVEALRNLKMALPRTSLSLANDYKMMASTQQYPWADAGGRTPLPAALLEAFRARVGVGPWAGSGAIYAASREQGHAERRLVEKALRGRARRLIFLDDRVDRLLRLVPSRLMRLGGIDLGPHLDLMFRKSPLLGFPTEVSIRSTYWRKTAPPSPRLHPDLDRCGVLWCTPAVPFTGEDVRAAVDVVRDTCLERGFEPNVALLFMSERFVSFCAAILFDRDAEGEDERALACHDAILEALIGKGYLPFRLGIQSMQFVPPPSDDSASVFASLKRALDPNDILAPGRYDFR